MEAMRDQFQDEVKRYQKGQQDYEKYVETRQKLDGQLNENKMVFTEMEKLSEPDRVYKLVGPVLVKQDVAEAKQTVTKRMDYISGEIKRYDGEIESLEKKQEDVQGKIMKMQQTMQQSQAKASAK